MQNHHAIAYYSHVLPSNARKKLVYERELMAIVFDVQKWWHYLLGRHFVVRTDQRSLKFLLEQRMVSEEHKKWLTKLLGYSFDIQYQLGVQNKAADALSRVEPTLGNLMISTPRSLHLEELKQAIATDDV
ncbi:hypothetical protein MA16_Dca028797 [Olea europaea subsp. europaea]|uniref:Reverse transcriptase RNase H-like domain-containing protein n=1 Tax=Olea europaea subsp. europaea TaxID=158383 RepID=A0A8S0RTY5_OLEEU|nr:hypothetical protein MA16_Dca028797 [Olea europaea subsp. europaea]